MSAPYHAIVILGASIRQGFPSSTLRARLDAGHAAFERGMSERIIVTGFGEAEAMHRYLVACGVPAEAIELEPRARTTQQNAIFIASRVPAAARLLLVTQASHQPRASRLFAAQGLRVEPLLAAERFSLYVIVRERLASLHHRLLGWF